MSSISSIVSSSTGTTSASAAASSTPSAELKVSGNLKIVGIILAIASGVLIGASFVFKKKGLLRSQKDGAVGEGVAYLKSPLWWLGMIMMIAGELCNFAAYAFVEAIVVTPMGALSVVVCAILSSIFLKEKLSLFGWLGCTLCIIGSVIIALNGPSEPSVGQIKEFQKMFLAPGFLVYGSILIVLSLVIIFWFGPRYGKKSMLWYILVCSMIGGISVSVTTGLGSAIVTTAKGDSQFKYWFMYFLMVFVIVTLITEVYYLNVALALFNTAMVTPTYYVIFTFFSIITTIVLFKGLSAPPSQIITLVMGFLVICVGITVLQLSKIDPTTLADTLPGKMLDRKSTIVLQAARASSVSGRESVDIEKEPLTMGEEPGIDALRGGFGIGGSIIRARRMSMSSKGSVRASSVHARHGHFASGSSMDGEMPHYSAMGGPPGADRFAGMKKHQLYDPPVSRPPESDTSSISLPLVGTPQPSERKPTIKFGPEDTIHTYALPGKNRDQVAKHEQRPAHGSVAVNSGLPYSLVSNDSSTSTLGLPLQSLQTQSPPLSAPPTTGRYPFETQMEDPFANSPSTATLASFHSFSATSSAHSPSSSNISSPHDETPGASSGNGRRSKSSSSHAHGQGLFGHYPRGNALDDKEESESLWQKSSAEEDSDLHSLPGTSVRLVTKKRG